MLTKVKTSKKDFDAYKGVAENEIFNDVKSLSGKLKGRRVVHVNATAEGGGVAEILKTLVPLMNDVGLRAEWYTIPGEQKFFDKKFLHDSLQGKKSDIPDSFFNYYLAHLEKISKFFKKIKADIWVIHDPQPAGVIKFLPELHPSIIRFHVDLSSPNKKLLISFCRFLMNMIRLFLVWKIMFVVVF